MVEVNREVCVCWLVVSSALEVGISVVDEINSDVLCLSVAVDGEDGDVPNDEDVVSSVEILSLVGDSNVVVVIADIYVVNVGGAVVVGSVSVVEVNTEVCVCWLVVCSALELGISAVDEINSNVLCPSVIVDNEDGEVLAVDNIVSAVDPLSPVEDSNVDILVGDIAVVNVD